MKREGAKRGETEGGGTMDGVEVPPWQSTLQALSVKGWNWEDGIRNESGAGAVHRSQPCETILFGGLISVGAFYWWDPSGGAAAAERAVAGGPCSGSLGCDYTRKICKVLITLTHAFKHATDLHSIDACSTAQNAEHTYTPTRVGQYGQRWNGRFTMLRCFYVVLFCIHEDKTLFKNGFFY